MRSEPAALPARHAVALGLLHGPAELLPLSSSAHTTLVPLLLGWPYPSLPADVRKAFEVALHAGTLAGLVPGLGRPRPRIAVVSVVPAAVAGVLGEDLVQRRLGTPRGLAFGLLAGSAVLLGAEARATGGRDATQATATDALVLGLAQAVALVPGLSRSGLVHAAARARGFDRPAAAALVRETAAPVLAGATALKAVRLVRDGLARELRLPFAAGAVAAAASARIALGPLAGRPLPVRSAAAERVALALATLARV